MGGCCAPCHEGGQGGSHGFFHRHQNLAEKQAPPAEHLGCVSTQEEDALHASTLRNCFAGCEHRLCSTEPGCDQVLVGGGCGWLCLSGGTKWQCPRWPRCRNVL